MPTTIFTIDDFRRDKKDNGSPEVQIAILSNEISGLQDHIKTHIHDVDAKRSLLKKVSTRRKFIAYLKKKNTERYKFIAKKLKLKTA